MNETQPEKTEVLLTIEIDREIRRIFKIWCINNNTSVAAYLRKYIIKTLSNHNPELTEIDQRHLKTYLNSKK